MDGLLVDSEPHWRRVEIWVFECVGVSLTEDECKLTTGLPTDAVVDYWFARRPWNEAVLTRAEIAAAIIEGAHREIGLHAQAMPGAIETLRFFRERNLPMGIASASPMPLIEVVIDRLDIRNYFTIWHSATLEAHNKPAPDVYLGAARKLGVEPGRCIAFEDSGNGLRSAHAAGMLTVAVPADYEFDDPKFDIATIKIPALTVFGDAIFQEISRT